MRKKRDRQRQREPLPMPGFRSIAAAVYVLICAAVGILRMCDN
jgi:hypothetical protein